MASIQTTLLLCYHKLYSDHHGNIFEICCVENRMVTPIEHAGSNQMLACAPISELPYNKSTTVLKNVMGLTTLRNICEIEKSLRL